MCKWCNKDFAIGHGGLNDLRTHAKGTKHNEFSRAKLTTMSVVDSFNNKEDLVNAAKEGMQVYHMVRHNQSFESMKCTSEILRCVYDQKQFACSATKSSAIVTGVFEPMILNQIKNELELALYVCLSTGTSSRNEICMYPVVIFCRSKELKPD